MPHKLTLKALAPVTHDTNHYVFDRPEGIDFEPGQAAALMLDREGWRGEDRPFTFTSQPEDTILEFVIKSYPDHDGVTERLPDLSEGDHVLMTDPFGAITDHGPGVFIAAGAGVTPFISILRRRSRDDALSGSRLLYSNKTEADIILKEEWERMDGLNPVFTVTDEESSDFAQGRIDRKFLQKHVQDFEGKIFYICGPEGFVDDVRDSLKGLGAEADNIITEEGW